MSMISAASQYQTAGIEQLNLAISLIDSATEQNATMVGQAADAADALKCQADNLAQLVSVFRIKEGARLIPPLLADARDMSTSRPLDSGFC